MKTLMFPGQGSQARGMGGTLFDEFKELTGRADQILGYSIKELCLEDPRRELNKTQFTQPALYVVNALSYYKKIAEAARLPDFLAGHSLGEFNALLAAECFDFEVGLQLVKKRGELMSHVPKGAMAAIVNATKEQIEAILQQHGLSNVDLANYNTPSQIVISGLVDEIGRAQAYFQRGQMLYYPLNTSGAFHSRFMRAVQDEFQTYLRQFNFSDAKIPVISNVTARPYGKDQIVANLSQQIASTVRWSESIQYLMELAANDAEPMLFEEVGHGDVLTKLVASIKQQTPAAVKASQPLQEFDAAPGKPVEAAQKVADWNRSHPVGTKVKSSTLGYPDLETRTEAVVLFGHRAAVYMKGYNGYFDLDEVAPL